MKREIDRQRERERERMMYGAIALHKEIQIPPTPKYGETWRGDKGRREPEELIRYTRDLYMKETKTTHKQK